MQITVYKKDSFSYYSFFYDIGKKTITVVSDNHIAIEVNSDNFSDAIYETLDKLFKENQEALLKINVNCG